MTDEEIDFIQLLIEYILAESPVDNDHVNTSADGFLSRYAGSKYQSIIRDVIRVVLIPGHFSWAVSINSGSGRYDKGIGTLFKENFSADVNFNYTYKNWLFMLDMMFGPGGPIEYQIETADHTWTQEFEYAPAVMGFQSGYSFQIRKLIITPMAGVMWHQISDDRDYFIDDKIESPIKSAFSYGIQIELPIRTTNNGFLNGYQNSCNITFRYGRSDPDFESWDSRFTGTWEYAQLGFTFRFTQLIKQK